MTQLRDIIELVRPQQWTKNLVVFAAILFSPARVAVENPLVILKVVQAFFAFCCLSGSIYAFNDWQDLESDKQHPAKSKRPLASGRVSPTAGLLISASLASLGVVWTFALDAWFGWIGAVYLAINLAYSLGLKHAVILDVLVLSFGFVLRAVGGIAVIWRYIPDFYLSYWLLLCAFLLSLFLALAKRRHEIVLLGDQAASHRTSLLHYSTPFIDQLLAVLGAATLLAYSLYTISDDTLKHYGTRALFWTIPFVVYGLFRYLYLIYNRAQGGDPTQLLLRDRPTMINVLLWAFAAAMIVYFLSG
ncbi:MAG: decaprenyl-phosphate phosphoribosyltransferase [Calditrichaeota bacterium]|nr:decaprenyl-phosphate phosphoribosyltransferase [Calditrichota bacterium]